MITTMNEDMMTIRKGMGLAHDRLEELRNNLENNRKSNAKQATAQNKASEEEQSSFISSSSMQKFSSSLNTSAVNSILFVPLVHLMSDLTVPDPTVILRSRSMSKRVKLNVGGIRYVTFLLHKTKQNDYILDRHEVMWKILETVPDSRLGLLTKV